MKLSQQIRTTGSLQIIQEKSTKKNHSQNSTDMFVAKIILIVNPYIKSNITDNQIIYIQDKITKILTEYKKVMI